MGPTLITLKERGPTPRGFAKVYRAAAAKAWESDARLFHATMRDNRFTEEHARKAKYSLRKGQLFARGSKQFNNSYYGRKFNSPILGGGPQKALPFVKTGRMRSDVRAASISATSNGAKARYPGARPANFTSRGDEFTRLIEEEIIEIAENHERELEIELVKSAGVYIGD